MPLKTPKKCTCQTDKNLLPYILPSVFTIERHVITSDTSILPNDECAELFEKGAGYHPDIFGPVGSQPELLYEYLEGKLDEFCEQYRRTTGVDARELKPFRAECAFGFPTICQAPQFLEPEEGHTSERLSKHASTFLEWPRERFVFIYVKKTSSRFAIVCRWLCSYSVVRFLESFKHTFEQNGPPSVIMSRLSAYVRSLGIAKYANKDETTEGNTLEEPTALKIFYLVPKMLKSPTKWRPISGPPFAPLTALSVTMTSILNAIQDSADTIWQNLVQSALG